ncbi:MAG: hypothetical protein ACI4T8_00375 [Christensenellales bacterium]
MIKQLDVVAEFTKDGKVFPLYIIWDNGKKYFIDKIIDRRPMASLKGGGVGTRYTCVFNGQERYLFLNDYVWWIEVD